MEDPVLSRRSIRKYTGQPVTDEHVERLLTAAMARPRPATSSPGSSSSSATALCWTRSPTFHPFSGMLAGGSRRHPGLR